MKKKIIALMVSLSVMAVAAIFTMTHLSTDQLLKENVAASADDPITWEMGDDGESGLGESCWKYTQENPSGGSVRGCASSGCTTMNNAKPQSASPQIYCK